MGIRTGAWMTLVVVLAGVANRDRVQVLAQSLQPDASRAAEMRTHYGAAIDLQTAVIRGNLVAAAEAAQTLTVYPNLPARRRRARARSASFVKPLQTSRAPRPFSRPPPRPP